MREVKRKNPANDRSAQYNTMQEYPKSELYDITGNPKDCMIELKNWEAIYENWKLLLIMWKWWPTYWKN